MRILSPLKSRFATKTTIFCQNRVFDPLKIAVLAAALFLFFPACASNRQGPESDLIGVKGFVGKRWAAGVEIPLPRVKVGAAITVDKSDPPVEEGEPPFSDSSKEPVLGL